MLACIRGHQSEEELRKDGRTRQHCRQQAKGAVVEMDPPLLFCGSLAVVVDTSMFETGNRHEAEEAVGWMRKEGVGV